MSDRTRISASALRQKWMSADAASLIHDHQTGEVVVRMADSSEFACSFDEHSAAIA